MVNIDVSKPLKPRVDFVNIVIVGQGAIGLLWYHQLSKACSNNVQLLCSSRITSAPQEVRLTDIESLVISRPLKIANDEALARADIILICVKSYHIESAIKSLKGKIKHSTSIVFCHNGMLDTEVFSSISQPCYTLLTTHASKVIEPFHIAHTGIGHNDIGLLQGVANSDRQKALIQCLSTALPSLSFTSHIKSKQWLKLAINCVINPITAIFDIDNGQISAKKYSQLIINLLEEVIVVAEHDGVTFELEQLSAQIRKVAKHTAKNCSSMRSDVQKKRLTEIDYINGYVINLAKKFAINTSYNERIVNQVKNLGK